MNTVTALIAEDEPLLRAEIRALLQDTWPGLAIVAEASDGLQAIAAIDRHAPQVVFLDIHMPGASGMAVAEHASGRAHVVFVTAYDQHAIEAFERGAVDYVLKPPTATRLRRTVERLQQRLRDPPADVRGLVQLLRQAQAGDTAYLKWLTVPHGRELRVVAAGEICYLRADHKYTTLATRGGTYLLTSPLKALKERLDPEAFWQIHRGTIVNVSAIETVHRTFRGALEVKLRDRPELLPVSSSHAHLFRQF